MTRRISFTRFELETIIDALNAAEAAGTTDWQESYTTDMNEAEAEAWLARSAEAIGSAAVKAHVLLERNAKRRKAKS